MCCCDHNEPSAYLDHSRNAHPFSLSRLAWAIQQGVDAICIARYLEGSNTGIVAPILSQQGVRDEYSSYPILFFAGRSSSFGSFDTSSPSIYPVHVMSTRCGNADSTFLQRRRIRPTY